MNPLRNRFCRYLTEVVALTLVYIGTAKLADLLTGGKDLVPPVWPPTGVSQAALLLLGSGMWPGVLLGEFFTSLSDGIPWTVACGTAVGCSLQAIFGVELTRRWGVHPSLCSLRDVFGFIVCAVILSTPISPTIGIASLYLGGQFDDGNFYSMWWTWWLRDAMGVLVVTPVLLAWCYPILCRANEPNPQTTFWTRFNWHRAIANQRKIVSIAVWLISQVTVSWVVFGSEADKAIARYPLQYLLFPLIVVAWAALQFGQRGAVLGTSILSGFAIWGMALGHGPFIHKGNNLSQDVLLLQTFIGLVAVTTLLLAATVTERAAAVADLTEHKETEEALARENEELENRIEERTAALRETNRHLLAEVIEHRRIEQARRESERRFRAIFDGSFQFIGLLSPDGTVLEVNQTALTFAGINASDVVDRPFWEARWWTISQATQQQLKNAIATAAGGEFVRYEVDVLRADESALAIDFSLKPFKNETGQVVLLISEGRDISDRKRAEAELYRQTGQHQLFAEISLKIRQSLKLETILQTTVTEVQRILQVDRVLLLQLAFDGSGTVVTETVSPGWATILGHKIDDPCFAQHYIEQYRQGRFRSVSNLQQTQVKACHLEMLQQFGVKANLVVPILQREELWGLLIAHQCNAPRQWQDFEIELLRQLADQVGIALAQSQLLENETKTRQQLAEQNLHLEQARREAEAASRAKSEFLTNMSHELRTPLNGILGYAQILKREPHLSPKQQQSVDIIQQCGEHLLTLLNDILDLSKIEARKMELSLGDFQFPQFLQGIIEIVRIHAEQKNITFSSQQLSELPEWVRGDEKRLRQVLINLLGNAVKFTDKGGVAFKVGNVGGTEKKDGETGKREDAGNALTNSCASSSQCPTSKMRFIVEDTGIGMATEQLAEIFLPFHQIGEPQRRVEGTGLGLAISQKLMQLMGTQLNVESTLGQGSVFWFDLDLSPGLSGQETTKADKRSIRGFRGHKRKVLVADDRWENRSIFVNLLLPLGFEVLEATDGRDCLDRALKTKPDAILLDLVMPGINGLDVTRRLRQLPELKDVVILATSTHVFHDSQQNCLLAGCDGFIPQPVQTENLFEQLKVHLDLEWIHEEASDVERLHSTSLQPLVAPPPSEMAVLYELAIIGDIKGISEQAKKLEQLNEQFVPFAQQLTQLAKGFQEKQILEFVKRYMVSSG